MEDQLSQLDELSELDMLDAFGEATQNITIEEIDETKDVEIPKEPKGIIENESISQNVSLDPKEYSSNDLASLLSQLLNNKTIEITIKIKD